MPPSTHRVEGWHDPSQVAAMAREKFMQAATTLTRISSGTGPFVDERAAYIHATIALGDVESGLALMRRHLFSKKGP
jgi:hypothetical protein